MGHKNGGYDVHGSVAINCNWGMKDAVIELQVEEINRAARCYPVLFILTASGFCPVAVKLINAKAYDSLIIDISDRDQLIKPVIKQSVSCEQLFFPNPLSSANRKTRIWCDEINALGFFKECMAYLTSATDLHYRVEGIYRISIAERNDFG